MTAGVGTSLWMAPEVMIGDRYNEKADMFSFGVVLGEIECQQLPYSHAKEDGTGRKLPGTAILQMVAAGQLRLESSQSTPSGIYDLVMACTSLTPSDRPTAGKHSSGCSPSPGKRSRSPRVAASVSKKRSSRCRSGIHVFFVATPQRQQIHILGALPSMLSMLPTKHCPKQCKCTLRAWCMVKALDSCDGVACPQTLTKPCSGQAHEKFGGGGGSGERQGLVVLLVHVLHDVVPPPKRRTRPT